MRFISELIEKKKATEPDAASLDGKARMTGGLAMHDATRRRPVSLIGESFPSSQRRRDTSGWGADPDDLADTLEGGPEHASAARPRNGFHRAVAAVRRTEIPREKPAGIDGAGAVHPMQNCGRPSEIADEPEGAEDPDLRIGADVAAEDAMDAPLLLTEDAAVEEADAPLAEPEDLVELDEAAIAERNLNLAFETPLKAVSERLSEEAARVVTDADASEPSETEADAAALELDAAADAADDVGAFEGWDDDAGDGDWEAAEAEMAEAGADTGVEDAVGQTLRVWDLDNEGDDDAEASSDEAGEMSFLPDEPASASMPEGESQPMPGPRAEAGAVLPGAAAAPGPDWSARPRAGRVKTRLLGFHRPEELQDDPFAVPDHASAAPVAHFPVGWLVVVDGPGRGASHPLFQGVSTIGRSDDQTVPLDYGDTSISRQNHAAVAYDEEQNSFYIGHGGKANLVRLNGMPVLSTEPLTTGDRIRIGETTLRFVALCGSEFSWGNQDDAGARDAATI